MNEEKSNTIGSIFSQGVVVVLAILVIIFTVTLDAQFINRALPEMGWLRWTALAVLDIGILGWSLAFIKNARGIPQKAISLVMIAFDFLGVAIISSVEILTGGQRLYEVDAANLQAWGIRGLIAWVIVNALALLVYHLVHPKIMKEIKDGMWNDKFDAQVDAKVNADMDEMADKVAEEKKRSIVAQRLITMGAKYDPDVYRKSGNGHSKTEKVDVHQYNSEVVAGNGNPTKRK